MKTMQVSEGTLKLNGVMKLTISIVAIMSMLIGGIAGMTVKSMKIEQAYDKACQNEISIHEIQKMLIKIDTNLEYIKKEIEDMR